MSPRQSFLISWNTWRNRRTSRCGRSSTSKYYSFRHDYRRYIIRSYVSKLMTEASSTITQQRLSPKSPKPSPPFRMHPISPGTPDSSWAAGHRLSSPRSSRISPTSPWVSSASISAPRADSSPFPILSCTMLTSRS